MKKISVHKLAFTALIAAIYAALTMALGFISYGNIQFRIAEALCILPFFFPITTWGLFIGCLIANLLSPVGILDIVFGSLATLCCCLCIAAFGRGYRRSWTRNILACLMPVIWNAVVVGVIITVVSVEDFWSAPAALVFAVNALQVGFGELAVMFVIGLPLMRILPDKGYFKILSEKLQGE